MGAGAEGPPSDSSGKVSPVLKAVLYFQKPRSMQVIQGKMTNGERPVRAQMVWEEELQPGAVHFPLLQVSLLFVSLSDKEINV